MPFQAQPGESVLYPAPFVPTELHALVITNKRVLQFSAQGNFPVAEFPVDKIEHVGRMSERPGKAMGIVAIILGLVFLIVFVAKLLPQVLYAGPPKASAAPKDADNPEEEAGDDIEGRDVQDDNPFEDGSPGKDGLKDQAAKRLKKAKSISLGLPGFNEDTIIAVFALLAGGLALFFGRRLYKNETHRVFVRVGDIVYPIDVPDTIQQNAVLTTISAVKPAR